MVHEIAGIDILVRQRPAKSFGGGKLRCGSATDRGSPHNWTNRPIARPRRHNLWTHDQASSSERSNT